MSEHSIAEPEPQYTKPSPGSASRVCLVTRDLVHQLKPAIPLLGPYYLARSYRAYLWLKDQSFDEIHFHDCLSDAYWTLLAKHQGLGLATTRVRVEIHRPTRWEAEVQQQLLDNVDDLERDALERRCVELADVVSVPNADVRDWMSQRGWKVGQIAKPQAAGRPLVSVCLVTHDRPALLRQAVDSLRHQDYPHFEVVLVDDGSETSDALDCLKELETEFQQRGWSIIRQDNRYLGAARNTTARHARGDYLLFMDDDNLAKPHEISTLAAVAERTGADVVTTLMDLFTEIGPDGQPIRQGRWLCSGVPSLAVGLSRNCFGDANALVRRTAFDALGGFTEDRGVSHEDWEFLVKIVLHGFKLEIVPEALFWYRVTPNSMVHTTPRHADYQRPLRPYLEDVPEPYRDIIRLAQGLSLRCHARPLRYQWADAIHARLGGLPRLARRLIQRLMRPWGRPS